MYLEYLNFMYLVYAFTLWILILHFCGYYFWIFLEIFFTYKFCDLYGYYLCICKDAYLYRYFVNILYASDIDALMWIFFLYKYAYSNIGLSLLIFQIYFVWKCIIHKLLYHFFAY
jgi:hypothetical protein